MQYYVMAQQVCYLGGQSVHYNVNHNTTQIQIVWNYEEERFVNEWIDIRREILMKIMESQLQVPI